MLFTRFGINYNNLPLMFRKGSTLLWESEPTSLPASLPEVRFVNPFSPPFELTDPAQASEPTPTSQPAQGATTNDGAPVHLRKRKEKAAKLKRRVVLVHEDLINDAWWETGRGAGLLEG